MRKRHQPYVDIWHVSMGEHPSDQEHGPNFKSGAEVTPNPGKTRSVEMADMLLKH